MRREQAERLGIRTISDLLAHSRDIRPGFGPEFMNRPDGYPGLVRAYGLEFAHAPREMDRNLLYQALAQGSIDLAAGDSTDGRIAALDLVQLEDDRQYFPPYEAVPLVARRISRRFPELQAVLNLLAGKIDAAAMRRDEPQGRPGEEEARRRGARQFLLAKGLISQDRAH